MTGAKRKRHTTGPQTLVKPDVRFGSKADMTAISQCPLYPRKRTLIAALECPLCANSGHRDALFDHLIDTGEQRRWHGEAECLCSLEVDHQLVLGRRLNRHVGRLLALEDAVDIAGRAPVLVE